MRAARLLIVTMTLFALAACGGDVPPPQQDKEQAEALGRDTDATVFDDMIQTQDKARAVEDLTLGRKDDLDQAMQQAEGSAPADQ